MDALHVVMSAPLVVPRKRQYLAGRRTLLSSNAWDLPRAPKTANRGKTSNILNCRGGVEYAGPCMRISKFR